MNNPHYFSYSLATIFWVKILKFFDADPGSWIFLTLDPGWKKFGSGITDTGWKKFGSGIPDKHPGSATLITVLSWGNYHYLVEEIIRFHTSDFVRILQTSPSPSIVRLPYVLQVMSLCPVCSVSDLSSSFDADPDPTFSMAPFWASENP